MRGVDGPSIVESDSQIMHERDYGTRLHITVRRCPMRCRTRLGIVAPAHRSRDRTRADRPASLSRLDAGRDTTAHRREATGRTLVANQTGDSGRAGSASRRVTRSVVCRSRDRRLRIPPGEESSSTVRPCREPPVIPIPTDSSLGCERDVSHPLRKVWSARTSDRVNAAQLVTGSTTKPKGQTGGTLWWGSVVAEEIGGRRQRHSRAQREYRLRCRTTGRLRSVYVAEWRVSAAGYGASTARSTRESLFMPQSAPEQRSSVPVRGFCGAVSGAATTARSWWPLAAMWFALSVVSAVPQWPGVFTVDSQAMYRSGLEGNVSDWYAPLHTAAGAPPDASACLSGSSPSPESASSSRR